MSTVPDLAAVAGRPGRAATLRHLGRELWRYKAGLIGLAVIVLIILAALFAPLIAPYDPAAQTILARLKPPAWLAQGSYGTRGTWRGAGQWRRLVAAMGRVLGPDATEA